MTADSPALARPLPEGNGRKGKSEAAFRTISEVAEDLDVPQHVLRFWESRFSQIRPLKRGGGRRYYRPEDVTLLRRIRDLLYRDGYTIKGVQKLLKDGGLKDAPEAPKAVAEVPAPPIAPLAAEPRRFLEPGLYAELKELLRELQNVRLLLPPRA